MSDEQNLPEPLLKFINDVTDARANGREIPTTTVDDLFPGERWSEVREQLNRNNVAQISTTQEGDNVWVGVEKDEKGRVFSTAASIPRRPGRAESFLQQVADYADSTIPRADRIELFRQIYKNEGVINNAINKAAALVASKGAFKVRYVKGQRGKGSDKRAEEFRMLLQFWAEKVNSRPEDGVITGARGIQTFIHQGVRQCLIEGDHVFRLIWRPVNVPALGGTFNLPIVLQSFPGDQIEIPEELANTDYEVIYWVPPRDFIQSLQAPRDPNVKDVLDKVIPPDVRSELQRDGRYYLEPSLMAHIKHRGTGTAGYGESFVEPAMADIAYKRALMALDIVTIENLINRLVFVKIGSDSPDSVYHKQEVSSRRVQMLQQLMRRVGPSALVIWAGPDLETEQVSAHDSILDTDDRFRQAQSRIRESIGMPSFLLTGEGVDGKAAGISAIAGISAQLGEVQEQYAHALGVIAERIAMENGFEDVDVIWEFFLSLLANKTENANLAFQAYDRGLLDTRTALEELGHSYESVESRMLEDVDKGYRDEAFGAPKSVLTTNPGGEQNGGGGEGRPTNEENIDSPPDPRRDQEDDSGDERK